MSLIHKIALWWVKFQIRVFGLKIEPPRPNIWLEKIAVDEIHEPLAIAITPPKKAYGLLASGRAVSLARVAKVRSLKLGGEIQHKKQFFLGGKFAGISLSKKSTQKTYDMHCIQNYVGGTGRVQSEIMYLGGYQ